MAPLECFRRGHFAWGAKKVLSAQLQDPRDLKAGFHFLRALRSIPEAQKSPGTRWRFSFHESPSVNRVCRGKCISAASGELGLKTRRARKVWQKETLIVFFS